MCGIGRIFARLPLAAAMLAGVVLAATLPEHRVVAQTSSPDLPALGEDMAAAMPRLARPATAEVALAQPLSGAEAARLRLVFRLQEAGDMAGAARAAAWLEDATPLEQAMFAHVLADRYLNPAARPGAAALRDWLARWPALPEAPALYRLLLARLPDGAPPPPAIATPADPPAAALVEDAGDADGPRRNPELDHDVCEAARTRGAAGVLRLLGRTPGLTADYAALLRGEAAQILRLGGQDAAALTLAGGEAGGRAAVAGFAAGLAAWRLGRIDDAGASFAAGWRARLGTPALRAAAAYWAGRVAQRQGDPAGERGWLRRAAADPGSFYGLLARRRLGLARLARLAPGERETLGIADVAAVAATGPGLLAFALLQVNQPAQAEAELRLLLAPAAQARPLARAVMLVAEQAGLPDIAARFADLLAAADGRPRDAVRFPLPTLRPAGGFTVDPALVYGIARTESNFDPQMVSSAGALGILQIMPQTARDMLGRSLASPAAQLGDPAFNLDLGQRYIAFLAAQEPVAGNLIALLASYNAGLANFARWAPQISAGGDPLLFIETIPIDETRAYVPRVLAYTWLYAARLGLPAPGLDELAAGQWPRYHARATVTGEAGWRASTTVAASLP